jgi:hypothetical protein
MTPTPSGLTDQEVLRFTEEGFVHLRGIVSPGLVSAGHKVIWSDLGEHSEDPTSWDRPVVRLLPSDPGPFKQAFGNPRLHGAFDQLVGARRWLPRPDLGLFVVRFPAEDDPGDTGWHIDGSFPPDEGDAEDFSQWRVNVFSRGRTLLMLFLYSDVGPDDAPTRIRIGSHLDVPLLLLAAGEAGMNGPQVSALAAEASAGRPTTIATGRAGDVYLCHPFLVHAAQAVGGNTPRIMAQPPLAGTAPMELDRADGGYSPVETAIRRGLGRSS